MIKVAYSVHSCAEYPADVTATLGDGRTVQAIVPGLVVELVSADGAMSHQLRFIPDDMEAAKAEFAVGNSATGDFTGSAP